MMAIVLIIIIIIIATTLDPRHKACARTRWWRYVKLIIATKGCPVCISH